MQKQIQLQKQSQNSNEVYLEESVQGIYLPDNHAKMIWQKNKNLIVDSCAYQNVVGKNFYVIGGNNCYGIVKITQERPITTSQFKELESYHKISEVEKKEWFSGKKILFAYSVEPIELFSEPKSVAANKEKKLFSGFVQFLSEENFEENLFNYDPKNLSTPFLKKIFVLTVELLNKKNKGVEIRYSFEDLNCFYDLLGKEFLEKQVEFPNEMLNEEQKNIVSKKSVEKECIELKKIFDSIEDNEKKISFLTENKKVFSKVFDFVLKEKESFVQSKNFFSLVPFNSPKVFYNSEELSKELFG